MEGKGTFTWKDGRKSAEAGFEAHLSLREASSVLHQQRVRKEKGKRIKKGEQKFLVQVLCLESRKEIFDNL